jgi:hypothetical protein
MSSSALSLKLQLRSKVADEDIRARLPSGITADECTVVVRDNCVVYRPDGVPLFVVIKEAFDEDIVEAAWPALHELRKYKTDNRGTYIAKKRVGLQYQGGEQSRSNRTRTDEGKVLNVASAIVGYFDRQGGRHPYCRTTAFTAQHVEQWNTILPLVHRAAHLFAERLPANYNAQMEAARAVHPAWTINGTPFSTLTVNNNTTAGIHKDAGDYKAGFGLMAVFKRGSYGGGWLGFPQYKVAADLQHRDLILFNPHEWHANTPYENQSEDAERISVVFYLREKLSQCGTPEEELKRARNVRGAIK